MDCREAFERHQAGVTKMTYEEIKAHFDSHEKVTGVRYKKGRLYEQDFKEWTTAWQYRQGEVDEYKKWVDQLQRERSFLQKKCAERADIIDELQKRFDAIKQLINDYHQHSYRESDDFVFYLEQALTGTNHIGEPNVMDGE